MPLRTVFIEHHLGFNEMDPDFEELAGTPPVRYEKTLQLKQQAISLGVELGGQLRREEPIGLLDAPGTYGVAAPRCYQLDFEFATPQAARQASDCLRDWLGLFGVQVVDPQANRDCQALFIVPDALPADVHRQVLADIFAQCQKYQAEQIEAFAVAPLVEEDRMAYRYQFDSAAQIEVVFTTLRARWGKDHIRFGWRLMPERMPDEM